MAWRPKRHRENLMDQASLADAGKRSLNPPMAALRRKRPANERVAALFRSAPWTELPAETLGPSNAVPSMISDAERRLYLWLTESWSTEQGAVVDLGAFAGGSTACLAEGLVRSGKLARVHAFDRFRADKKTKETVLYPAGVPPFEGADLLPVAQELLSPWSANVTLVPGEIEDAVWRGGPIEIMVIDAAKTARATDRIAEIFFPHLIPGHSIVVQQDFLHWKLPWLPAQMEWMSGSFTPLVACPRDTVVFLCTSVPGPDALAKGRVRGRRDTELADALAAAGVRFRGWGLDDYFAGQSRALGRNPRARRAKDFTTRP